VNSELLGVVAVIVLAAIVVILEHLAESLPEKLFPQKPEQPPSPPLRRTQPAQRPPVSTAATTGEGAGGEQGDVAAKRNVPKDLSTDWESDWIDDDAGLFWADPGGDESFAQDGMEEGAAFAGEPDAWPGLALTSAGGTGFASGGESRDYAAFTRDNPTTAIVMQELLGPPRARRRPGSRR
jgi:hypothetical protein